MRVVVQRVLRASVTVEGRVTGSIGAGLVVLAAFTHGDGAREITWMTEKLAGLRIFADADGKMNRSVADVAGSVLVVSQITLYGDARKGRRPSFVEAARPERAIPLYESFVAALRATGLAVATGEFGADMKLDLLNDGPVTLVIDRTAADPE